MKFQLIDKIELFHPGKRIVTTKALSLAEEYLADHFPSFPVLPGVLMLEAMTQSAAWLVRESQGWSNSLVVLQSCRNVRYSYFLKPGNTLRCEVDVVKLGDETSKFKGVGYVGDRLAVSAKLELSSSNLSDRGAWGREADERIEAQLRRTFDLIGGPESLRASKNET